ncbi:protocadherin-20 [Cololabis saira]|uniref:protocadherin-20 n=1 Tax=Cololabis saira TaxID=129043 RepID=UPI002AD32CDC|nr:protocadherin-20 [Cololabis saira]
MGYGTPYNMNWAGLLQNLLPVVLIQQIICGSILLSVPEEVEPDTLVGSLSEHFSPPYQLLTQEYLWMDKDNGNIYTSKQKLDREDLCPEETNTKECIILHNAVVGPSEDLIQFNVIIKDINDNAPHFENSQIHLNVPEDVTVGTSFLLDDLASDRDIGDNGELTYHLQGSDGVFTLKAEEDGNSVALVVQTALDRETQDLHQMQLVVTDRGAQPLSAAAALIVTVTDVNDNCPSFSSDSPRAVTVPGDSPENTAITQVIATDPDTGSNADIVYSFSPKVSERARALFSLESNTGNIKLRQDLQSDRSEEFVLKVLAMGLHCPPVDIQVTVSMLPKAKQELTIKIGFIAEHQNETILLPENQPPTGLAVLELEGDSIFKVSSIAIEGDVPFLLSPQNGKYLLSTSKSLDYEIKDEYHISVVVHSRSGEGSLIIPFKEVIKVYVVDVNDNAPHFSQPQYLLEVEENNQPGMLLLWVSASDADSKYNGRVTYRLENCTSDIFNIDSVTGQLSVSARLDREQQSRHKIIVLARDSGSPPLESNATVIIRVLDQNDNAPVFPTQHFIFFVPENAPPFTQVGRIEVKDPDEGENGKTAFYVVNSSALFVVDNVPWMLRTTNNLDRETNDRHELYLLASDNGNPVALTSTARVTVFVEDVNDNQPKVILPSSNSSCLTVSPATLAGTMVTKIYAIDEDSGLNSEITYAIVTPEPVPNSSPFEVDSRSGNITLSHQLLGKDMGMHHLFVVVRDSGKPTPLYTTVWVNLLVNESMGNCCLERVPTWVGPSDFVSPSKAPMCDGEHFRYAKVFFFAGVGMMMASVVLFLVTACLCIKWRSGKQTDKRGYTSENEIPLRLKDKYYSDK